MKEDNSFRGADGIMLNGIENSRQATLCDPDDDSDNFNIATMSDFQFNESLDALVDHTYNDCVTTTTATPLPLPTTPDIPTCFDVDESSLMKPQPPPQPQLQQQQPVTVHDNSYCAYPVSSSGINPNQQSLQHATTNSIPGNTFYPAGMYSQTPLMMPIGFDPSTFLATAATTTAAQNSFVPAIAIPQMTLQQSIEAFGKSLATHNQHNNINNIYPVASMPPFAMCVPPQQQQQMMMPTTSYATTQIPLIGSSNAALVASSSSSSSLITSAAHRKRGHHTTFPISEDESDFRKRKSDRNAREQQRAQQVTDQIGHLRELIVRSGVALEKVDKFSTLIAVEQYIRSLQTKSRELKTEHDNLLSTLQQTSEVVNSQYVSSSSPNPVSSGGEESCCRETTTSTQDSSDQDTDDHSSSNEGDTSKVATTTTCTGTVPFVKEINYKWIFDCCPFATGVASIDGRFLDCNKEFESMTGYTRAEIMPLEHQNRNSDEKVASTGTPISDDPTNADTPAAATSVKKTRNMSIFNILHRECIERLFCAMSKVLQKCSNHRNCDINNNNNDDDSNKNDDDDNEECSDTITQEVELCKRSNQKATIRITLVRSPKGLPRFFNCVLIPLQPA